MTEPSTDLPTGQEAQAAPAKPARKRGRENTRDMVLSLLAVMAVILPFYWLAGLADQEKGGVKPIDPSSSIASLRLAVPDAPVPGPLPKGWTPTSANLSGPSLRIGYVTPGEQYAEYAVEGGTSAQQQEFLAQQTGQGNRVTTLAVGDRTFEVWSDEAGATSLVLQEPGWTVVVGGVRENADDDAVQQLAASLR